MMVYVLRNARTSGTFIVIVGGAHTARRGFSGVCEVDGVPASLGGFKDTGGRSFREIRRFPWLSSLRFWTNGWWFGARLVDTEWYEVTVASFVFNPPGSDWSGLWSKKESNC